MDTQEQLPPNSFQSQISALDGIILTSGSTASTSVNTWHTQGITYYDTTGQVLRVTNGSPQWIDYTQTDWVKQANYVLPYYQDAPLMEPADRGIFGLMQLVKDE
jgi:hypothetical protein